MEALTAHPAAARTIKAHHDTIDGPQRKRRPSYTAVLAVSQHLADRHRISRGDTGRYPAGYVNESIPQIADALCLPEETVKRCLALLDDAGVWVAVAHGNRHRPTTRAPGFLHQIATADGALSAPSSDTPHGAPSAPSSDQDENLHGAHLPPTQGAFASTQGAQRTTPPSTPNPPEGASAASEEPRAERQPGPLDVIRTAINHQPHELDGHITALRTEFGDDLVDQALELFASQCFAHSARWAYASDVRKAIAAHCAARQSVAEHSAVLATVQRDASHTGCPDCDGHGWIHTDSGVLHCPRTDHPTPTGATTAA